MLNQRRRWLQLEQKYIVGNSHENWYFVKGIGVYEMINAFMCHACICPSNMKYNNRVCQGIKYILISLQKKWMKWISLEMCSTKQTRRSDLLLSYKDN